MASNHKTFQEIKLLLWVSAKTFSALLFKKSPLLKIFGVKTFKIKKLSVALNLSEISSRQTFWPSFMSIGLKMWPLQHTQGFSKISPGDLVFTPAWPSLNLSEILSMQIILFWPNFVSIGLKMWLLQLTQGKKLMTDTARRTQHNHNSSLWTLCAQVS